jgi:hypothetical protein
MKAKRITVSEIVSGVYCERKMVMDREQGEVRSAEQQSLAKQGTARHFRFEVEGKVDKVVDQRCFIATHIYGNTGAQTRLLRAWRDRVLMPTRLGRFATRVYYLTSPGIVRAIRSSKTIQATAKLTLDAVVHCLDQRK